MLGENLRNMNLRSEVEFIIEKIEADRQHLKELTYKLYKEEKGEELEGVPVEFSGYKKVLRHLGFVI